MDAREFLDRAKTEKRILRLAHYVDERCDGRGQALIVDPNDKIAVMLEDCGDSAVSRVRAGNVVHYSQHPEAEPRIIGSAADIRP